MILIALGAVSVLAGVVLLAAVAWKPHPAVQFVDAVAIFLVGLGVLWSSSLQLSPGASHLILFGGFGTLGLMRIRQPTRPPIWPLVISGLLSAGAYHFSISILDLALSTRMFASDLELLEVGLKQSLSPTAVLRTLGLAVAMIAGGSVGHWIGARLG